MKPAPGCRHRDVASGSEKGHRANDIARILDLSKKQIYKMAASGEIPSLRIANSVRFDPHDLCCLAENPIERPGYRTQRESLGASVAPTTAPPFEARTESLTEFGNCPMLSPHSRRSR